MVKSNGFLEALPEPHHARRKTEKTRHLPLNSCESHAPSRDPFYDSHPSRVGCIDLKDL